MLSAGLIIHQNGSQRFPPLLCLLHQVQMHYEEVDYATNTDLFIMVHHFTILFFHYCPLLITSASATLCASAPALFQLPHTQVISLRKGNY